MSGEEEPLIHDPEFEESVDRAHKFIKHPKVVGAPPEKAIAFLRAKNCSETVIQAALKRANEEDEAARLEEGGLDAEKEAPKKQPRRALRAKRRRSTSPGLIQRVNGKEPPPPLVASLLFCILCLLCVLLLIAIYLLLVFLKVMPDLTKLL